MLILGTVGRTMIEVEGLSLRDPKTHTRLLEGVDLRVPRREVLSVVSHDAVAGRALIGVLGGVLRTWHGQVKVLGRQLADWGPEFQERVGVSFARPNQHRSLSVRENLEHWRGLYRVRTRPTEEVLRWFGLESRIEARVLELDDEEMQRLSLACSLLHEPELWLLSVPYPSKRVQDLVACAVRGQRLFGTTVVMATQDLEWAAGFCDRVIGLDGDPIRMRVCG